MCEKDLRHGDLKACAWPLGGQTRDIACLRVRGMLLVCMFEAYCLFGRTRWGRIATQSSKKDAQYQNNYAGITT